VPFYRLGWMFGFVALLSCAGSGETGGKQAISEESASDGRSQKVESSNAKTDSVRIVETIPAWLVAEWRQAGLQDGEQARRAGAFFDVTRESGATWDEKVGSAVQKARSAAGLAVVYFPAGTYALSKSVVLPDASFSQIVFQGAGADSTVLEFTLGPDGNCFDVHGIESDPKLPLDADMERGERRFSAQGLSDHFSKGDWVRLCEAGFPEADRENVGQTTRLAAVDGSRGVLENGAAKTYLKTNELWVQKTVPVQNAGFENFTLRRMDAQKASQSAYGCGINFKFDHAVNFWMRGVASLNTCRHHAVINHSAHFEISGCYFAEACSRDENSYGYGILMEVCTNHGLVENNVFEHLRHSMTVCEGVNTNVLAFNYSRNQAWTFRGLPNIFQGADLCLHGRYPYANLFEQNVVEFVYADNSHGANGPYNVFLRNQVYHGMKGSGKIRLFRSPSTVILGNMSTPDRAAQVQYDRCEPFHDFFAAHGNGLNDHMGIRSKKIRMEDVRLPVVSLFYAGRPAFLGEAYTWPAIGPGPDGEKLTQSIPAKERCLSGRKTYLREPTR
jgi:hypothetical protein